MGFNNFFTYLIREKTTVSGVEWCVCINLNIYAIIYALVQKEWY